MHLFYLLCFLLPLASPGEELSGEKILEAFPLIDGHNDLAFQITRYFRNDISAFNFENDHSDDPYHRLHTDLPRLRRGRVGAQFFAAYVACTAQYKDAVAATLEQIDVVKRLAAKYPEDLELVRSSGGLLRAFERRKVACLLGVEGGHSIDSRIAMLRAYYELGVRYMTLTHGCDTPWADSAAVDEAGGALPQKGLTHFGRAVVAEMNRLGMLVDLSHASKRVMDETIRVSKAPVAFTHSNSFAVHNHSRNVHDDTLHLLRDRGGIVMVNFHPDHLTAGDADVETVVRHIEHIADAIGHDHVGIGSDFDGIGRTPGGLEDVSKYPALFDALIRSNGTRWTRENLEKLAGRNFLRVFVKVEEVRDSMKSAVPTEFTINERDIYPEGWTCRSSYEELVEDPLRLIGLVDFNVTAPAFGAD